MKTTLSKIFRRLPEALTLVGALSLQADAATHTRSLNSPNPWSPLVILKAAEKCLNLEKMLDELRKPQLALHLTQAKPLVPSTFKKDGSNVSERFKNNLKALYHAREMTTTDDLMAKGVIPVRAEQGDSCSELKIYLNRAHAQKTCFPGKNENGCALELIPFKIMHASHESLEMKNLKNAEIWRIEFTNPGELKVTRRLGIHQIPHRCDTKTAKSKTPEILLEKHAVEIERSILFGALASQPKGRDLTLDHIIAGDRLYEVELEKDSLIYCALMTKN